MRSEESVGGSSSVVVEEGQALETLEPRARSRFRGRDGDVDVLVIGGGQAGSRWGTTSLRRGVRKLPHPRRERPGRRLLAPAVGLAAPLHAREVRRAGRDALPGAAVRYFPTKDEMADYLEAYARHFTLPVRNGVRVDGLSSDGDRYLVDLPATSASWPARWWWRWRPTRSRRFPAFATELDPSIVQLHSSAYKRPAQLRPGKVLLVGAGNSGAEIAIELRKAGHPVVMSGPRRGQAFPSWFHHPVSQSAVHAAALQRHLPPPAQRVDPAGPQGEARAATGGPPCSSGPCPGTSRRPASQRVGRVRGVAGRPPGARGRHGARRRERPLVLRVPSGVLLGAPARSSTSMAVRARRAGWSRRAGPLLHRAGASCTRCRLR